MQEEQGEMNNTRITSDDLLIEILQRIPAKPLTRFRCVSKRWNHLIRCPDFASTHYNYSKTHSAATVFLFSFPDDWKWIFYTINDEGEAHHHLTIDTGFKYQDASEIINGIVCLSDFYHRKALVCNIATGEIVRLPDSCLALAWWYSPRYLLGFDPENNQYKVLCVWNLNKRRDSCWTAEVFTVGISRDWRSIDTLPSNGQNFYSKSVCVNGIIHWKTKFNDGVKRGLVSFNVRDEKFQIITKLPQNIWKGRMGRLTQLAQFTGHYENVNRGDSKLLMLGENIITRNSERFIVLEGIRYGYLRLHHYENDGIHLRSTRITGLKDTDYCSCQAAINEHVENIYQLARN